MAPPRTSSLLSARMFALAALFAGGISVLTANEPMVPDLSDLRNAVDSSSKRGDNVIEIAKALAALEKRVAKGWTFPAKGLTVAAPAELLAVREAVEAAKRKGENVEAIRKALELVEKAMTGQLEMPRLLVVSSNRTGNWEVYVVHAGTGELKNLTENRAADTEPMWSPDGKRIAFVSDREAGPEIWVMNQDGTEVQQLTKKSGGCSNLRWSPDAKYIAFVSPKSGKDNVFTVEVGTGKIAQLTDATLPSRQPAWSLDGKKISYTTVGGRWHGYLMNADGSGNERLSGNLGGVDMAWSPDGKRIAFTDVRNLPGWRLHTMDADGTNAKQLNQTGNSYGNVYPQWSPDGKMISYGEMVDGVVQVGVIGADGTGGKVVTSKSMHLFTRWSPDGKSLSYCRFEKGQPIVLVVSDIDGQNAKDLIRGVGVLAAEWKPK